VHRACDPRLSVLPVLCVVDWRPKAFIILLILIGCINISVLFSLKQRSVNKECVPMLSVNKIFTVECGV